MDYKQAIAGWALMASALVGFAAPQEETDWTIKQRVSVGGHGRYYTSVVYIQGTHRRHDTLDDKGNPTYSMIFDCSNHRQITLDHATKVYSVFDGDRYPPARTSAPASSAARRAGAKQHISITTLDTGERKQVLGHTARHVIVTTKITNDPKACHHRDQITEQDGWFIDTPSLSCAPDSQKQRFALVSTIDDVDPQCRDEVVAEERGAPEKGLPVAAITRIRTHDESSDVDSRHTSEVTELSHAKLDKSLFEIPPGYVENGGILAWLRRWFARH